MLQLQALLFLLSHGVNAAIALILVITSLRLYFKTKISLVFLMTILMTSWTITNTLLIVPLMFEGFTPTSMGVKLIASWNIIGSAIVPSVFIIFVDAFEGEIEPKKVSLAIGTIMVSFFISLIGLTSGNIAISSTIVPVRELITMRWSPISSLAIFPTVIICGIWTQQELNKSIEHALDEKQIRQINFMRIGGILMFFVGPAFGIAGVIAVDGLGLPVLGTYLSEIIGYAFVSIGIFMITLAYLTSDAVAFLQPQRIDSLIAILSTGIPILKYNFSPQEEESPDVSLISGAITAIKAIMAEAFNVRTDVRQIAFYDKELILDFEQLDESVDIAFVLITDRKSAYLESALRRFSSQFTEMVPDQIKQGIQLSDEEQAEAVQMLRSSFGLSSIEQKPKTPRT